MRKRSIIEVKLGIIVSIRFDLIFRKNQKQRSTRERAIHPSMTTSFSFLPLISKDAVPKKGVLKTRLEGKGVLETPFKYTLECQCL